MARAIAVPVVLLPGVNLLPKVELDRRDRAGLIRRWLAGMLIALVVALIGVAGAMFLRWTADQALQAENVRTNTLIAALASLRDVSQLVQSQTALEEFRAQAMVDHFSWFGVLATLAVPLPDGVMITGFDLSSGGAPAGEDPTAVDPALETGVTGSVTLTSPTPVEIVPIARAYAALPVVIAADAQELRSDTEGSTDAAASYTYVITLTFDQTIYTGDYAQEGEDQ